jgi:uncharacterized protein YjbJ (UPF0337 family)
MNSDQGEGKWQQGAGAVGRRRVKLTDNDIQIVAGKREQLIGRVQERYGVAKEAATKEVDTFLEYLRNLGRDFAASTGPPGERAKVRSVGR